MVVKDENYKRILPARCVLIAWRIKIRALRLGKENTLEYFVSLK